MARGQSSSPSVTLSWNADGDPATAGYMLYSGTVSGIYTQQINVGNVTSTTIDNLPMGTVTYFAVAAQDTYGNESPPSTEIDVVSNPQGSLATWTALPTYTVDGAAVSGTSVTFSASVDPNGTAGPATDPSNVYVWWQYGVSAGNYTQTTASQPIGTGTVGVPAAITVSTAGLAAAMFHYELVISSTLGNLYGPDQTFSIQPPSVAYTSAQETGTESGLTVYVNPNGLDTMVTIQYGTTTAYTSGTFVTDAGNGTNAVAVSADLSGLTPNVVYHYQVVTTNALGTFYGPDETFMDAVVGTTAMLGTGEAAPGVPGATFRTLGNPATNNLQHTAFQATITGDKASGVNSTNNSGIWADIGTSGLQVVARSGMTAPGYTAGTTTGVFYTLSDPVYANDDEVAFVGKLVASGTVYSGNSTGIWETVSGGLELVARQGDPAPDINGATGPNSPVFTTFPQFVLPDQGGVIVLANLETGIGGVDSTNNQGIWAMGTDGVFRRIVGKGDTITVNGSAKVITALSIFNTPAASAGQTRHFSSPGSLVYKVTLKTGASMIVQSVLP
jgi:hypothetical protein